MRAPDHILFIEDTFGQTPEKSRHSVFRDIPAQTENGRRRIEVPPERNHVVLIPAGSVEEQKDASRRGVLRWNEAMRIIHVGVDQKTRSGGFQTADRKTGGLETAPP
jgi:hypothetical protein